MTLRVYVSDYPEWVHESTQINFLLREFWRRFEKGPSNCVVIIGIELPFAQIDMLVIKDNRAVILELKNYSGTIYADCSSQNVLWKNERGLGLGSMNNFYQARKERGKLVRLLVSEILHRDEEFERDEAGLVDQAIKSILDRTSTWVVVNDDAKVELGGVNLAWNPWFRVCKIGEVPMEIMAQFDNSSFLSEQQLSSLLELVHAELRPWDNWRYKSTDLLEPPKAHGPAVSESLEFSRIPRLDFLFDSSEIDNVMQALSYVRELRLTEYTDRVFEKWNTPDADLRLASLALPLSWNTQDLEPILASALNDGDERLVRVALNYLKGGPSFPATNRFLLSLVDSEASPFFNDALSILEENEVDGAADIVCKILKHRLVLPDFQGLEREKYMHIISSQSKHGDEALRHWNELRSQREEFDRAVNRLRRLIEACGKLRCKAAVPKLIEVVGTPATLGLDVNEPHAQYAYELLSETAAAALAEIGDVSATPLLLEKLSLADHYGKTFWVNLLGKMRDQSAIGKILPFLNDPEEYMVCTAIRALKNLGTASFDNLARVFRETTSVGVRLECEEALVQLDKSRFEELLIQIISSDDSQRGPADFLRPLGRVATEKSVETLYLLCSKEAYYELASDILSYRFSNNAEVRTKATEMLDSGDQFVCASGILFFNNDQLSENINFEKFEQDGRWAARMAVCRTYVTRKDLMKALRFVKDSDKRVRDEVAACLVLSSSGSFHSCRVATSSGCFTSNVYLTNSGIFLVTKTEITWLRTGDLIRAGEQLSPGNLTGIFLRTQRDGITSYLIRHEGWTDEDVKDILLRIQKLTPQYLGEMYVVQNEKDDITLLSEHLDRFVAKEAED